MSQELKARSSAKVAYLKTESCFGWFVVRVSSKRIAGEAIWSCGAKGLTKLVLGFVFSHMMSHRER